DVRMQLAVHQQLVQRTSAPNVVGILEGGDAVLKKEYVLFTAHMDHIGTPGAGEGCTARGADSICNGADDDGSGTVAVIELAQAFTTSRDRPKRSLVFMTVSGEERGLWGSGYWADHPTVPLANVVADLNSDMVGRNSKDTVAVIGREHSNLGTTLDSVAAAHRELGIKPGGGKQLRVGLGTLELGEQHVVRFLGRELPQAPPDLLFGGYRRGVSEQLFPPRPARGYIHRGVQPAVGQRTRQPQLGVSGALE